MRISAGVFPTDENLRVRAAAANLWIFEADAALSRGTLLARVSRP
jgi:hypothetical protein